MIPLDTADVVPAILSALALVVAAVFGWLGVRAGHRAAQKTEEAKAILAAAAQKAQQEETAGTQALALVTTMRAELTAVQGELREVRTDLDDERDHNDEVREAWRKRDERDEVVMTMLESAMPGATANLPPRPVLPPRRQRWRTPREPQE